MCFNDFFSRLKFHLFCGNASGSTISPAHSHFPQPLLQPQRTDRMKNLVLSILPRCPQQRGVGSRAFRNQWFLSLAYGVESHSPYNFLLVQLWASPLTSRRLPFFLWIRKTLKPMPTSQVYSVDYI